MNDAKQEWKMNDWELMGTVFSPWPWKGFQRQNGQTKRVV